MKSMRRSDREITSRAEIDAIIRGSQVCRLGLARGDEPYVVPVAFGYDGQALFIHTAREGRKIDYFTANSRVCFEFEHNVHLVTHPEQACKWSFQYETVIGHGRVAELTDPQAKSAALNQIMRQYAGPASTFPAEALDATRVWRIAIDTVTGKRSLEEAG